MLFFKRTMVWSRGIGRGWSGEEEGERGRRPSGVAIGLFYRCILLATVEKNEYPASSR